MKPRSLPLRYALVALIAFSSPLAGPAAASDFLSCVSKGEGQPPSGGKPGEMQSFDETDLGVRFSISLAKREMLVDDSFDETELRLPLEASMSSGNSLIMHFSGEPGHDHGPYVTTVIFDATSSIYTETTRYLSKDEIAQNPAYRTWMQSSPSAIEDLAGRDPLSRIGFGWGVCMLTS